MMKQKRSHFRSHGDACPICGRTVPNETLWEAHHLTPKCEKGRETIDVCILCGDAIHQFISNKDLAKKYNTLEKLLSHPKIITWIEWIGSKSEKWSLCFKEKK